MTTLVHRSKAVAAFVRRAILRAHHRQVSRQSGFALLVVVVSVAVLGAVVSEFGYNARVEFEAAANARDQLRAEYLARSGINLSRLLIKVQSSVVDPINKQLRSDFQITQFAPFLLGAFGGDADERAGVGSMLGLDAKALNGMSAGRGGSFDVKFDTEDGKININCGGGIPPMAGIPQNSGGGGSGNNAGPAFGFAGNGALSPPQALYGMMVALMFPPRYNRMFENAQSDGQFTTRDEVARAIIDWTDIDEQKFDPMGAGSSGEDYRYDAGRDAYRARNNYFDTIEEVNLVRGVNDDFYGSFAEMFTVYGGCKLNLRAISQDNWPITSALIRATAQNAQDPVLTDDVMIAALAQQLSAVIMLPGTINNSAQWVQFFKLCGNLPPVPVTPGGQPTAPIPLPFSNLPCITINQARLDQLTRVGAREVYRIDSTGSIKRAGNRKIQVHIRAVFDTKKYNQNTTSSDLNDRMGTWQYWRME